MEIAKIILEQLGGGRFVAMTGAKNMVGTENALIMTLPQNPSKANRLEIKLHAMDTYNMTFTKYTASRYNRKTGEFKSETTKEIETFRGVYADQLQEIFTATTKMYTSL